MELKKQDIAKNHLNGKFYVDIRVRIEEYNPMMAKAKAEFVAKTIDGTFDMIEAKQAEFEEVYGRETVRHAHHALITDEITPAPLERKHVQSTEVQNKLLERAFN